MLVKIKHVHGLFAAMEAMRLSFNSESLKDDITLDHGIGLNTKDVELASKLVVNGDSHAKVMRMVQVWYDITAPRFWWAEFDTYKQGTATMSESTVHTIKKSPLVGENFENGLVLDDTLDALNTAIANDDDLMYIKSILPESFLQRRIVNTNYQTLRHIYFDRKNHRLPQWHYFIDEAIKKLPFNAEFITKEKKNAY